MRDENIARMVFTGLAFDYCVGWSTLDAVKEGFEVFIAVDATRSIAPASEEAVQSRLIEAGCSL